MVILKINRKDNYIIEKQASITVKRGKLEEDVLICPKIDIRVFIKKITIEIDDFTLESDDTDDEDEIKNSDE